MRFFRFDSLILRWYYQTLNNIPSFYRLTEEEENFLLIYSINPYELGITYVPTESPSVLFLETEKNEPFAIKILEKRARLKISFIARGIFDRKRFFHLLLEISKKPLDFPDQPSKKTPFPFVAPTASVLELQVKISRKILAFLR